MSTVRASGSTTAHAAVAIRSSLRLDSVASSSLSTAPGSLVWPNRRRRAARRSSASAAAAGPNPGASPTTSATRPSRRSTISWKSPAVSPSIGRQQASTANDCSRVVAMRHRAGISGSYPERFALGRGPEGHGREILADQLTAPPGAGATALLRCGEPVVVEPGPDEAGWTVGEGVSGQQPQRCRVTFEELDDQRHEPAFGVAGGQRGEPQEPVESQVIWSHLAGTPAEVTRLGL